MRSKKIKIMILSVGSLLGQNILDVLENRRENLTVIGANSLAENPRNFRCDRIYRLPELSSTGDFLTAFKAVIEKENPDIILPGRDDDVVFLAEFKEQNACWDKSLPYGGSQIVRLMRDKFSSFIWASKYKLPFARSFVYIDHKDQGHLKKFIDDIGFPLIAKPRDGFGSNGVYIISNPDVLKPLLGLDNLLFQEFLMPPPDLSEHLARYSLAPPLFFQFPETQQYSAQTLIAPDGSLSQKFTAVATMVLGRCERFERIDEPDMASLLELYAQALYAEGWRGPLNVQCKKDREGNWLVHEINLRMSGGTSARLLTGYDEFGTLMNTFYPDFDFPNLSSDTPPKGVVMRSLTDAFVSAEEIEQFKQKGFWAAD